MWQQYNSQYVIDRDEMYYANADFPDFKHFIKRRLADQLAHELLKGNAVRIEETNDTRRFTLTMRASVAVTSVEDALVIENKIESLKREVERLQFLLEGERNLTRSLTNKIDEMVTVRDAACVLLNSTK